MSEVQICLLRGINVGGHNKLPMADLRDIVTGLGAEDVKTYIQSGNAVFRGALTEDQILTAIEAQTGIAPRVMLWSLAEFETVLNANPFDPPDGVHVFFTKDPPKDLTDDILALASPTEAVEVTKHAAYLNAPDGIGRSKLAERLEKALGVPATARNWRSCTKIRELAQSL